VLSCELSLPIPRSPTRATISLSAHPHFAAAAISGRWVTLRPVGRDDYPHFFRWRSTTEINLLNFNRRIASYEEFVGELERLIPTSALFLVKDNRLGVPIGYTLGYHLNPWDGWMFVGEFIEKEFRYRGHGGEATLLGLEVAFRHFPVRMVYTEIYEFAAPLFRMATILGFEQVGYQPEHFWHDDRFWGLYRLVLTRDRWAACRNRFTDILDVQEKIVRSEANHVR
jgi:RimJ/RimL family protein N-acetyltransferase